MAVGRISGPLLKDNLLRDGVDLAFETSLLYLDVTNRRVGINTSTPQYDLDVNTTFRTTNLTATNTANLATFTFNGNVIGSSSNTMYLVPSGTNAVVYQGTISVGSLTITGNTISTLVSGTDINISPSGAGLVNLNSNTLVNGNLHATGNITADGNITLGNAPTDTVTFDAEIASNILPSADSTYNLGSPSLRWNNIYVTTVNATTINSSTINAQDIKTSDIDIGGNTISTYTANTDINLSPNGSGSVVINNLKFANNTITNTNPNEVTTFLSTGNGYYKFGGTYGVVIPVGDSTNRPLIAADELGMIRFNTLHKSVEVWNGAAWASVAGDVGGINTDQASDISIATVLTFG